MDNFYKWIDDNPELNNTGTVQFTPQDINIAYLLYCVESLDERLTELEDKS